MLSVINLIDITQIVMAPGGCVIKHPTIVINIVI
jgi:hypothetical protein